MRIRTLRILAIRIARSLRAHIPGMAWNEAVRLAWVQIREARPDGTLHRGKRPRLPENALSDALRRTRDMASAWERLRGLYPGCFEREARIAECWDTPQELVRRLYISGETRKAQGLPWYLGVDEEQKPVYFRSQ